MRKTPVKLSGLSIYNSIKYYAGKGYSKFLVLYDREYYDNFDKDKTYLEDSVGVRVIEVITLIEDKALQIKGELGSRGIEIFVSIQGDEKSINEEISRLIKLKFSEDVEADDKTIKRFLKEKGIQHLKILIKKQWQEISGGSI